MPEPKKKMGRPMKENPDKIVKTIRLSEEMIEKINDYAEMNNITFGKAIKIALNEFFK